MIVRMEVGIDPNSQLVTDVVAKAQQYGLRPDVRLEKGTHYPLTEIYLLDGERVRSCTVSDHIFRLPGVDTVERVTPSMVTLACNGVRDAHHIQLGQSIKIGYGLPCQPIIGPCTVYPDIKWTVRELAQMGIKAIRGGCWKPRSSAYSFRGFGRKALCWLLEAAGDNGMEIVWTEALESKHIDEIRRVKKEVGYTGEIGIWIGARSAGNQELHVELGKQHEFPVIIKNGIYERMVRQLFTRVEFVLAGPMHWREDGTLDEERSLPRGNNRIGICVRGTESLDPDSPFRFAPNHSLITTVHEKSWAPVGVDPSHSAGTMRNDLVLKNLAAALAYGPDFAIIEAGYPDDCHGRCDAEQNIPLGRVPEVLEMIAQHNRQSGLVMT